MHLCIMQHIICSSEDHSEGVRACGSNVMDDGGGVGGWGGFRVRGGFLSKEQHSASFLAFTL